MKLIVNKEFQTIRVKKGLSLSELANCDLPEYLTQKVFRRSKRGHSPGKGEKHRIYKGCSEFMNEKNEEV